MDFFSTFPLKLYVKALKEWFPCFKGSKTSFNNYIKRNISIGGIIYIPVDYFC